MKDRRSKVLSEYGQCYKWNDTTREIPIAGVQSGLYKIPIYDLYPQMQHKRSAPKNCWAALIDRNAGPIVDQYDKEECHSNQSKHSKSGSYLCHINSDVYSEYRSSYTSPSSDYRQARSAGLPSRILSCKTVKDRISDNSSPRKVINRLMESSYDYHALTAELPNAWSTEYKLAFAIPEQCDMSPAGRKIPLTERSKRTNFMNSPNQVDSSSLHNYKTTEQLAAPTAENCIEPEQIRSDRSTAKRCPKQKRDLMQTSSEKKSTTRKKIIDKNDSNDKENRRLNNTNGNRNSPRTPIQNGPLNGDKSKLTRDSVSLQPMQTNNQQIANMKDQRSLARQYQRRSWNTHLWWWVDGGGPVLREESVSGHTTPTPNVNHEIFIEEKASSKKSYSKEYDISDENESGSDDSEDSDTPRVLINSKRVGHNQTVATQFPMNSSPDYVCDGGNLKDYQFYTTNGKREASARSNQGASTQRTSSSRGTYRLPDKDHFATSNF